MSRNGSGTYSLPAGNPVVTGTTIASTWANNTLSDIATALTGSVAADGQTPMTGNLDLNSNKIVNVTDPTLAQDAATKNYTDTAITTAGTAYLAKASNLSDVANTTTARTNLGLGSIATQNSNNVSISGGSISGISLNANDISSGTLGKARLPSGSVLQVVSTTKTDTFTTTSTSFIDITGLSVSITPTSSSSKILVMYSLMSGENASNFPMVRLVRDSTAIAVGDVAGSRTQVSSVGWGSGANNATNMQSMNFLDSPATTSSTTYKLQILATGGHINYINRNARDDNADYEPRGVSSITVMEIAA